MSAFLEIGDVADKLGRGTATQNEQRQFAVRLFRAAREVRRMEVALDEIVANEQEAAAEAEARAAEPLPPGVVVLADRLRSRR